MLYRPFRLILVALIAVAMLATAVPATAGEAKALPIKEDLSGYVVGFEYSPTFPAGDTFGTRCSVPSQWVSTMAGTGVISHLGRVSWELEQCYQMSDGSFTDAEVVVTAANGDQLYGEFDGVMTGETTFAETLIITGGTGRFVGATGSIDETGWFDPDTGYLEVIGSGVIVYDASNRALH